MNNLRNFSIIIPAYNEEKGIAAVLKKLVEFLGNSGEIIIVDDGSSDNTADIAKDFGVKVIRHSRNMGYGAALKTGFRNAKNNIVVIMDADEQHNPKDLTKLIENIKSNDMVVGVRNKKSHFSFLRYPGKLFLHWVANYLMGEKIPDLNSGFRAIKKERVEEFLHILPNGFSFSTTITLAFLKSAYNVKYVPIVTYKRKTGKSRINFFKDGPKTLLLIVRVVILFNPLKVFVPAAFILFIFGFIFTLYGIIKYHSVPGSGIITILSAIIIFFFGALADQIAAIRRSIK